ncbi:hypothetical protein ABIB40_004147 [Pedobacter sp. UYP30]|uniref:hypothetical protein n=1 Tax=Pedobacter sp. UYP30 TaxID=1756400 RepID=UPI003399DD0F
MKKMFFPLIFCLIFIHLSCKKESDIIDIVSVSGKVWDSTLQKPVSNFLVYIYDVKCENFHCGYNKIVDSTRTDVNGFYKIDYPRKNYNDLYLTCGDKNKSYTYGGQFQISKGGTYSDKNFLLKKTSVVRARVIVKNNKYPPLYLIDDSDVNSIQIYGLNKDTVVYFRGVANSINGIMLYVNSDYYSYYRRRIDEITLGPYADTLNVTINADDPDNFPVKSK